MNFPLVRISVKKISNILSSCSCSYILPVLGLVSFSGPCLPDIQPGLCSFQRVFVFRIFCKLLNDFLVWQNKPTVSHSFFSLWCSTLALPLCFHSLGINITHLCIRHWPIRNKIVCWVYNKYCYLALFGRYSVQLNNNCHIQCLLPNVKVSN